MKKQNNTLFFHISIGILHDFFHPHSLFMIIVVSDADKDQSVPNNVIDRYNEDYDRSDFI